MHTVGEEMARVWNGLHLNCMYLPPCETVQTTQVLCYLRRHSTPLT